MPPRHPEPEKGADLGNGLTFVRQSMNAKSETTWTVRCECGETFVALASNIRYARVKRCKACSKRRMGGKNLACQSRDDDRKT